ncbi:MAG: hypothetical protein V9E94_06885 [Microthrixaceae bacterium]
MSTERGACHELVLGLVSCQAGLVADRQHQGMGALDPEEQQRPPPGDTGELRSVERPDQRLLRRMTDDACDRHLGRLDLAFADLPVQVSSKQFEFG